MLPDSIFQRSLATDVAEVGVHVRIGVMVTIGGLALEVSWGGDLC
jgi:hypothetical protein